MKVPVEFLSSMPWNYGTGDETVDDAIVELVNLVGGTPNADLVKEIVVTALKSVEDRTSRGDLKIINSAMKEMRYAFKVFSAYRRVRKVSMFGSARTDEEEPEYVQAQRFAEAITRRGFMVITGAGDGIMKAGHSGAGRDKSFGVNIRLPFELSANSVIRDDPKLVNFKYFFTRKLIFVKESDASVLFPGGFGTLDEGFECLVLVQTGKSNPAPIVMLDRPGGDYWRSWDAYIRAQLLARRLISEDDVALYKVTDSVDEACAEIERFYRRYHSSRYVRENLVIRMNQPLDGEALERIRTEFADLVESGTFEQTAALPEEGGEKDLVALPRLVFHFRRRQFGRLRKLIDQVNDAP